MATFGTPRVSSGDCANALAAARDIVDGMASGDAERVAAGLPPVRISVGIHFGPAILGNIGSERRLEFATRTLDCRIVASDAVMSRVGDMRDGFRRIPSLSLRGREAPIDVWVA